MKKFNLFSAFIAVFVLVLGVYSCGKETPTKKIEVLNIDEDEKYRQLMKDFEAREGIIEVENNNFNPIDDDGITWDDLCSGSYVKDCGPTNYNTFVRRITYKQCPIDITYRFWFCYARGAWRMSFQIVDWQTIGSCSKFKTEFFHLFNQGLEDEAAEFINEMYRFFHLTLESTRAGMLALSLSLDCNNPVVHSSIIAVNCYKICDVPVWGGGLDDDFNLSYKIQRRCARNCCFRNKKWCVQDGVVIGIEEFTGGRSCGAFQDPCPETPRRTCAPACDRL